MKAALITLRLAFAEAVTNRVSLWTQVVVVIVNDLLWVAFWVIFFEQVGSLQGWDVDRVLLLLAVLTTSAGIVLGLFHNVRNIGTLAADGGLDATLALPVHPLPQLLTRSVAPVNLGDLAFGVGLFVYTTRGDPQQTVVFVFCVACSSVLILSFLLLMGSLTFFVGRNEAGELGFHAILVFSSYPVDIFSGVFRVLLYTAVPAGFVTAVPAALIDEFAIVPAVSLVGVAVIFAASAITVFDLGLRRYTSGATWR